MRLEIGGRRTEGLWEDGEGLVGKADGEPRSQGGGFGEGGKPERAFPAREPAWVSGGLGLALIGCRSSGSWARHLVT